MAACANTAGLAEATATAKATERSTVRVESFEMFKIFVLRMMVMQS
jgi:hypothetical protein